MLPSSPPLTISWRRSRGRGRRRRRGWSRCRSWGGRRRWSGRRRWRWCWGRRRSWRWRRRRRRGRGRSRSRCRGRRACCQLETANPRAPVIRAGRGVILVRIPERGVINWIDSQGTVIAPAVATAALAPSPGDDRSLSQSHGIQRIGRQSPGIAQLRMNRRTRSAVTQTDVSLAIHRDASHPAPGRVWLVSAFLVNRHRPGGHIAQLKPADTGNAIGTHCEVADH